MTFSHVNILRIKINGVLGVKNHGRSIKKLDQIEYCGPKAQLTIDDEISQIASNPSDFYITEKILDSNWGKVISNEGKSYIWQSLLEEDYKKLKRVCEQTQKGKSSELLKQFNQAVVEKELTINAKNYQIIFKECRSKIIHHINTHCNNLNKFIPQSGNSNDPFHSGRPFNLVSATACTSQMMMRSNDSLATSVGELTFPQRSDA